MNEYEKISKFSGEIGIDKSAKRVRDKKGIGANKTSVFGMLKRDGKVYTQVLNCSSKELLSILKEFSNLGKSVIYLDS
ncbi:hypothetical protein CSPB12327_06990 [Campylobacter sp. RM12327]|nr:hypothetical protein [Campylobacter sp. RM11302]MBF6669883.1 hypothetical protein [Campylobacter sp. RM12327]MBF6675139.1 hypothetical protein [Campylobacter sp. RM13538]MBF6678194.1 hypothetical protein [Campylobacter sp. RM11259]